MKVTAASFLTGVAVIGVVAGGWVAIGGRLDTPADVLEDHVEESNAIMIEMEVELHDHTADFEGHVAHIDSFVAQYEVSETSKIVSRARRTLMVEAQTKLTCLATGSDTIAMLGLTSICGDLGVPVN